MRNYPNEMRHQTVFITSVCNKRYFRKKIMRLEEKDENYENWKEPFTKQHTSFRS